jgi:hypothetical protein
MIRSVCSNAFVAILMAAMTSGRGAAQSLLASPDLRIDGAVHELGSIGGLAIGRGGLIAVVQSEDQNIRFFDSRGRAVGKFGRAGEGPGEFRQIQRIGPHNDGFWISDRVLRRITLISSRLDLVGSIPAITSVRGRSANSVQGQGIAATPIAQSLQSDRVILATLLLRRGVPHPAWLGAVPDGGTPIVRISESGEVQNVFGAQLSASGCSIPITTATGGVFTSIPFCAQPLQHIADDGRYALFVTTTVGSTPGTRVTLLGERGDTLFSRLMGGGNTRIPNRVADSAMAERLSWAKTKGVDAELRELLRIPNVYPLFRDAIVGRDGTVWLAEWSSGADVTWRVLDAKGASVGSLKLPGNFRLSVAERSQFWGVEADGDGVESIIRYRVR